MFQYTIDKEGIINSFSGTNLPVMGTRFAVWKVQNGEIIGRKTHEELKSEGLDHEGNSFPTPEQIAIKAKTEKLEQEKQVHEAELAAAKAELGEGAWTAEQIADRAFKIKQRDLQNEIMQNADAKQKAAYRAILLHNIPDTDRWQISSEQIRRYEVKLTIARDSGSKICSAAEKVKIIAAFTASEKAIQPLIVLIDSCRRVLQSETKKATTEKRLGEIRTTMQKAALFHTKTPKAEMDAWAQGLGGWLEV